MIRCFLYARKSTDDEERQILSIDAQLTELREFARKENLVVVEEFIESRTAKVPGRPIFNSMMERIQLGEAQGILAWHPDRLARNSVDGGLIIYLSRNGAGRARKHKPHFLLLVFCAVLNVAAPLLQRNRKVTIITAALRDASHVHSLMFVKKHWQKSSKLL